MKVSWQRASRVPRWPWWAVAAIGLWAVLAGAGMMIQSTVEGRAEGCHGPTSAEDRATGSAEPHGPAQRLAGPWHPGYAAGAGNSAAGAGPASGRHSACLFKEVTHLPCPSCGSGRAAMALARGRVLDAVAYNPLLVTAGAAMMLWMLLRLLCGRSVRLELSRREQVAAALAGGLALAGNWAYLIWQGR